MPQFHVLTLELHDDPALIADYERHHAPGAVWPEVVEAIRASGIIDMRIHRSGTLLIMTILADDTFDFAAKTSADLANPAVQRWERLMERFQRTITAQAKWRPMHEIFVLSAQPSDLRQTSKPQAN